MKKKLMVTSTIVLLFIVLLVAGNSMAWFTSSPGDIDNQFEVGTVLVEVREDFPTPAYDTNQAQEKNIQVESLGNKQTYIRVRLVPEWSDPSLSVSNVQINLANNSDWVEDIDGYYYFKYYLTEGQVTRFLVDSVTFTTLPDEYEGAEFSLKVVAEGVQASNDAYQTVWGLEVLPFTPNQSLPTAP